MHKTLLVAAFSLLATGPALALGCSEGSHFANAEVYPAKTMGTLTTATQYAWDGGTGIVRTCNLTTESGDLAGVWNLFSGEIDVAHGGICIALTNSDGRSWYSCVTPDAVARASAARPDTPGFALSFRDWQTEVAAFRR
ncbi:hypothetical protein [Pararhodobacter aggregans]|uniref:DUF3757 domain-containing protein n=1 Tax=Pararhodobacter aggregans TaxID=404875 RepID=A0A2T7UX91_9RHOB|nr:hypothetical protein [Pararhodobacter aggregans]PTX05090.1 hypothetical protein C8N33_101504 [Pararhodobacter aggregans]PVE49400.1 hypothetical protein DDE23_03080 [Pararhodobacter aggregans]